MVSVPRVEPGDVVFWHCDAIHAVDPHHAGAGDSAVLYVPAGAACASNDRYVDVFLARSVQWEQQKIERIGFGMYATL